MRSTNLTKLMKNAGPWMNRVLIGTPMTGLVRSEWVVARYGQTIPTNWSHVEFMQWMSSYIPLQYQVADAENLIAKHVVEQKFEWLLFIEHDNLLPPNTFIRLNHYMIKGDVPVVSGLYFTKSEPPEPMIYREPGHGFYADWKLGDKVWCRGLPFGCTLIHGSLIRELWKDAPEYTVNGIPTRKVFKIRETSPDESDPGGFLLQYGTSDLLFCNEIIEKDIFTKAGWSKYAKKQYPFLVDTRMFVKHIDNDGTQWPIALPQDFAAGKKTFAECLT